MEVDSGRAPTPGRGTVGVMLAATWADAWADDEAVAVSVRVALPNADHKQLLPDSWETPFAVPPDVAATLTRNASGMWAADLPLDLLDGGVLGGAEGAGGESLLLRVHLLNVTVRWREDGEHPEARFSRAVREQVAAALGADGYGVREEFERSVRTSIAEGPEGEAHSQYTWRATTYNASAVGELLWWLVHANLQCHGLDDREAYKKMEAVVGMCDMRVGRLKSHPKVRVVVPPDHGPVRYLDDQGDDLTRLATPCKWAAAAPGASPPGSAAAGLAALLAGPEGRAGAPAGPVGAALGLLGNAVMRAVTAVAAALGSVLPALPGDERTQLYVTLALHALLVMLLDRGRSLRALGRCRALLHRMLGRSPPAGPRGRVLRHQSSSGSSGHGPSSGGLGGGAHGDHLPGAAAAGHHGSPPGHGGGRSPTGSRNGRGGGGGGGARSAPPLSPEVRRSVPGTPAPAAPAPSPPPGVAVAGHEEGPRGGDATRDPARSWWLRLLPWPLRSLGHRGSSAQAGQPAPHAPLEAATAASVSSAAAAPAVAAIKRTPAAMPKHPHPQPQSQAQAQAQAAAANAQTPPPLSPTRSHAPPAPAPGAGPGPAPGPSPAALASPAHPGSGPGKRSGDPLRKQRSKDRASGGSVAARLNAEAEVVAAAAAATATTAAAAATRQQASPVSRPSPDASAPGCVEASSAARGHAAPTAAAITNTASVPGPGPGAAPAQPRTPPPLEPLRGPALDMANLGTVSSAELSCSVLSASLTRSSEPSASSLPDASALASAHGSLVSPRSTAPHSDSQGGGLAPAPLSGDHVMSRRSSGGGSSGGGAGPGGSKRTPVQPWSLAVLAQMAGAGGPDASGWRAGYGTAPANFACVMCLDGPREHGFLHGGTVHVGVCGDCAARLALGPAGAVAEPPTVGSAAPAAPAPAAVAATTAAAAAVCISCPVCRQPVDRIVEVIL
ncbi:hypothetical protein HYH03_001840 [Edaphochlamys debaryana]|uniref:Uncharacterized protein n=1 Tax=Edaphochlamys debaryana TaxID=47281 RepID=A0A836C615_9CHLO|nr:hypothetical protein HYH03_001840 [Edaphochlamys debaryana]|eukprot:KAG2500262.1 hypothetical protein HYH03_001840 [Edaphochlamys debaryana]